MRLVVTAGVLAAGVLALTGCGDGKGDGKGLDDGQKIASLVTEFADTGDAAAMQKYFAPGGTKIGPAEYKKYVACNYKVDGKPAVNGSSATATVQVTSAKDEKALGSSEWTFEKDGDKWKVKSAPLP